MKIRYDIPEFEIPEEIQRKLRRMFASKAIPGGEPHDTFIAQPAGRHELRVWSDSVWTGVQAIYRTAIADERERNSKPIKLANLEQALRIMVRQVKEDASVPDDQKELEIARRAYRLAIAKEELGKLPSRAAEAQA